MRKVRVGGKRDYRHYISLSNFYHIKLKKLAISCNMSPAELSYFCLKCVLHDKKIASGFREYLQAVNQEKRTSPGAGRARVAKHFLSLDQELNDHFLESSFRVGINPSRLHYFVLKYCLDSPNFINFMQDEYNTNIDYKVYPVISNGEVFY